jgi:NADH-quinone oxidoreductase subunit A
MGEEYTPIFLFLIVAILAGASMIILSASPFLNPSKTTRVKQMPYESGMDPIGDARQRFDVRFYLVAIVFLLFDVELLFLYPWAVAQWSADPAVAAPQPGTTVAGIPAEFRGLVFWEIFVFIVILAGAFAYAWRKGVFEWR